MRGLKQPGLGLPGVGKRPALEPEQLGLDQALGDGCAVDLDPRAPAPATGLMNRASEQPFADASLPLNQEDGQPAPRPGPPEQPLDLGAECHHSRTAADQPADSFIEVRRPWTTYTTLVLFATVEFAVEGCRRVLADTRTMLVSI